MQSWIWRKLTLTPFASQLHVVIKTTMAQKERIVLVNYGYALKVLWMAQQLWCELVHDYLLVSPADDWGSVGETNHPW